MPAKPDREPMPSALPLCKCGHVLPATRGVLLAEHDVHHAERETPDLPIQALPVVHAYRDLVAELRAHIRRLDARLVDWELEHGAAVWDLGVANEVIADRDAEIEDLRAGRPCR